MFRLQSIISYRLLSRESIFAALLGMSAGVLSIEFWLQFQMGSSLCQTSACQAVAEFVRIGEPALVLFGSGFFWLLFVLALIGMVTSAKWIWTLIGVALFGALAFDGALIGYQFVGLGQKCYLCLAVGIALAVRFFEQPAPHWRHRIQSVGRVAVVAKQLRPKEFLY